VEHKRTSEVFQDSEPIYFWNNTGAGNHDNPAVVGYGADECHNKSAPSLTTFIQANRDYFHGQSKAWLHPLPLSAPR
jgi:hypothetical protein